MTYDDLIKELREMKSHYDGGFSSVEKNRIADLYWYVCGKRITNLNCPDCYRDAFIDTYTTLQRMGKLPEEKHYILLEGKCLHIFGSSEYLFDVTDEQAETFLSQCPEQISQFKSYPEDWEERVKKRNYKNAAAKRASARKAKKDTEEQ